MKLDRRLLGLAKCLRDDIPPQVVAEWVMIMRGWRDLDAEEWEAVKRQIVLGHRDGPLRLSEILDAFRYAVEAQERRQGMQRLREVQREACSREGMPGEAPGRR